MPRFIALIGFCACLWPTCLQGQSQTRATDTRSTSRRPATDAQWREYVRELGRTLEDYRRQNPGGYDLLAITNRTNRTITYDCKWVHNGEYGSRRVSIRPGETLTHASQSSAGDIAPPQFHIQFSWSMHSNGFSAPGMESYLLKTNRSSVHKTAYAKQYYFGWRGNRIDLFDPDQ